MIFVKTPCSESHEPGMDCGDDHYMCRECGKDYTVERGAKPTVDLNQQNPFVGAKKVGRCNVCGGWWQEVQTTTFAEILSGLGKP